MIIERIQTGVRLEKRLVLVLNHLVEEEGGNLGQKLEEIVAHALEGNGACAWSDKDLKRVAQASKACGLNYGPHGVYRFKEADGRALDSERGRPLIVQRIQVGLKMEKRMLKVLKALAELHDYTLGRTLEEIILHQMQGVDAFTPGSLQKVRLLQKVYGMTYETHATYRFKQQADLR